MGRLEFYVRRDAGSLPFEWSSLQSLVYMDLPSNNISGTHVQTIMRCQTLEVYLRMYCISSCLC